MKRLLLILILTINYLNVLAQETYTVEGETLELKTEVEGKLDLLWAIVNQNYRYFIRTEDGVIQELKNTRDSNNDYQEEYQDLLKQLTERPTDNVRLTLYDLKQFIDDYNGLVDGSYQSQTQPIKLSTRLGGFVGLTNSPFVDNPENSTVPYFGAELEFFSENKLPKHAGFFSVRHQLENDDFPYQATQLALGYRYRFINKPGFNIYGNLKIATYTFSSGEYSYEDPNNPDVLITKKETGSSFEAPLIFGLGTDIKLGKGYLTLAYQEIFSVFLDMEGNFPVDFAIGYKFDL